MPDGDGADTDGFCHADGKRNPFPHGNSRRNPDDRDTNPDSQRNPDTGRSHEHNRTDGHVFIDPDTDSDCNVNTYPICDNGTVANRNRGLDQTLQPA